MNIKFNHNTLIRIENIFIEARYVLRYEKGTFNSGYCILEDKKVIVVNKFLGLEGKISIMLDILPLLDINIEYLTLESQKLYQEVSVNRIKGNKSKI